MNSDKSYRFIYYLLKQVLLNMKQTFQMIVLVTCALFMALTVQAQNATKVYQQVSPDNNVHLSFELQEKGKPSYSLQYKKSQVINPSTLGLELNGQESLQEGFEVVNTSTSSFDETWQPVWGENKDIRIIITNCWWN